LILQKYKIMLSNQKKFKNFHDEKAAFNTAGNFIR